MMVAFKALRNRPPGDLSSLTPCSSLAAKLVHQLKPSRTCAHPPALLISCWSCLSNLWPFDFLALCTHPPFFIHSADVYWTLAIPSCWWCWGNTRSKVDMIPPQWGYRLVQELASVLSKGPLSAYFKLCRSYGVCRNYLILPLSWESDHWQNVSKWTWPCSSENLFTTKQRGGWIRPLGHSLLRAWALESESWVAFTKLHYFSAPQFPHL